MTTLLKPCAHKSVYVMPFSLLVPTLLKNNIRISLNGSTYSPKPYFLKKDLILFSRPFKIWGYDIYYVLASSIFV